MYARKLRYDENFIAPRDRTGSSNICSADPINSAPVASPARELQGQLKARVAVQSLENSGFSDEKYSSSTSLAIVAGSSLILWLGIISTAVAAY